MTTGCLGSSGWQTHGVTERITVDDPHDPRVAVFVGLRDQALRGRREAAGGDVAGLFIAEGDLVVERAARAGYRLRALLLDATRTKPLPVDPGDGVPIYAGGPDVIRRITGLAVHRGVMGCFERRPVPDAETVLADVRRVVVCENVANPTNLGLVARSAVALGIDALLLDPTSSDPLYRRASRVSMGEVYALPYAWTSRLPEGLAPLRRRGFEVVALTPDPAADDIGELAYAPEDRVALVLGAEGPGLSDDTLSAADRRVRIPLHGAVDSLNVASAAAIAVYVLGRR